MPELHALLRLDDRAGPAPPLDAAATAAMIDRAVDAAFGAGPGGGGGGGGSAAGGGGTLKLWLGAAVVLGAAVAAWLVLRKPAERGAVVGQAAESVPIDAALPAASAAIEPEPEPELEIELEVDAGRPPPRPKPPAAKPEPPPPKQSADDLLAAANAARRKRAWKDAEALYSRVVADHKGTRAAHVALVASATLRLEHLGDPKGAAKRFRAAVKGPLAEEARFGLAEALRALGDDAGEARALDDFLRHHPGSPLADRARARREEL